MVLFHLMVFSKDTIIEKHQVWKTPCMKNTIWIKTLCLKYTIYFFGKCAFSEHKTGEFKKIINTLII